MKVKRINRNAVRLVSGGILGHLGKKTENWIINSISKIIWPLIKLLTKICHNYTAVESLQRSSRGPPAPRHPLFPGDKKVKNPNHFSVSQQRPLVAMRGSVCFPPFNSQKVSFVCLLSPSLSAASLLLHRTHQKWEMLWFCHLQVHWEEYWKRNSRHAVLANTDGPIRLKRFLKSISCLQRGLILSFLQLQFQFVTRHPEILQPRILVM